MREPAIGSNENLIYRASYSLSNKIYFITTNRNNLHCSGQEAFSVLSVFFYSTWL